MRRRLLNFAAALSLLFAIAVTWAWIVNLSSGGDGFPVLPPWFSQRTHAMVIADRFTLSLCVIKLVALFKLTDSEASQLMRPDPAAVQRLLGFGWLCRRKRINGITKPASLGAGWWGVSGRRAPCSRGAAVACSATSRPPSHLTQDAYGERPVPALRLRPPRHA